MMMHEKLKEIVLSGMPNSNFDAGAWKSVLENCEVVPSIFHLINTTEYYVAYFSSKVSVNLSVVLYDSNQPVGVMPLMVHKNDRDIWIISSNGTDIVEPIFLPTIARKVRKKHETQLMKMLYRLSEALEVSKCHFTNMSHEKLSNWYLIWAERANDQHSTHHLLVDLSFSLENIRLSFRKSFKPLVTKGLREWRVEVHEIISDELFSKFRLLHKEVAGGSTRPIESWAVQKKQIDMLESFLVTVSDSYGDMVGAGLFTHTSGHGLYCVGVYKRDLFDKPLGHAVQMEAIKMFKKRGCTWYELGQKHLKVDRSGATEKELSISHFKEGFSNHVVARQHVIVNMKSI